MTTQYNALQCIQVRDRECMQCGHTWCSPIEFDAHTQNLSGERTVYCPECSSRGCMSSPAYYVVKH